MPEGIRDLPGLPQRIHLVCVGRGPFKGRPERTDRRCDIEDGARRCDIEDGAKNTKNRQKPRGREIPMRLLFFMDTQRADAISHQPFLDQVVNHMNTKTPNSMTMTIHVLMPGSSLLCIVSFLFVAGASGERHCLHPAFLTKLFADEPFAPGFCFQKTCEEEKERCCHRHIG